MRKLFSLFVFLLLSLSLFAQTWDQLSELEKNAVAFSSNLFEINKENHLDFSNKSNAEEGKQILKDSWGITDYQSLVDNFKTLEERGHSGAYDELIQLLDKHKKKSILEIAQAENLDVLDTSRLYYASTMKTVLGSHGIEAWDEGREITTLRWGIGAGYISYEEAVKLLEPIVERIQNDYVSWDDYMAHYIAGRCFYGLYSSNYKTLAENSIKAAENTRKTIPYKEIKFTAKNADKKHVMTFDKSIYKPSKEALRWEEIQKLSIQEPGEKVLAELEKFEAEYPECKNITFWIHLDSLRRCAESKAVVGFIESYEAYLEALPAENEISINTKYAYMYALNDIGQPQQTLIVFDSLPDSMKTNVYFYYQYACAYYILSLQTPVESEKYIYESRAVAAFEQCEKTGYTLNDFIKNWIKSVK